MVKETPFSLRYGPGPNDLVAVVLSDKLHRKFSMVRIFVDATFVVLGFRSSKRRLSSPTSHTTGRAVPHPAVQLT